MKNKIINCVLCISISYICFSFFTLEINPIHWNAFERFAYICIGAVFIGSILDKK